MHEAPKDLSPAEVSSYLKKFWGIEAHEVTYAAVGAGSHNWVADRRWFIKADRSGPNSDFFRTSYRAARALADAGLEFVLAPIRDLEGDVRRQVNDLWDMGVFPFLEGRNPSFEEPKDERSQVAEVLGRLHSLTPIPAAVPRWEPSWLQPELRDVLANQLDRPWVEGPLGERARLHFIEAKPYLLKLLRLSDELVAKLERSDDRWVATQGEPHSGNTFLDSKGSMHLIDFDAPMVAPRERDLRVLLYGGHGVPDGRDNSMVIEAYRKAAGPIEPRQWALELFRAEWHLIEIARYAFLFSGPHGEGEDVALRWRALNNYLRIEQNWPALA